MQRKGVAWLAKSPQLHVYRARKWGWNLLSCLGMLERAQAASRLHRWLWLSASKMSDGGPLPVCCERQALVCTCCSLSALCLLYLQGPLLVPRVPWSLFVRHFLGEEDRRVCQQIHSVGERIASMPRREEMGSRQAGKQCVTGPLPHLFRRGTQCQA